MAYENFPSMGSAGVLAGNEAVMTSRGETTTQGLSLAPPVVVTLTASATIDGSYSGKVIEVRSAAGVTLTFGVLQNGFNCGIWQTGAGQVTLVGTSNRQSFTKTAGQGSALGVMTLNSVNWMNGDAA